MGVEAGGVQAPTAPSPVCCSATWTTSPAGSRPRGWTRRGSRTPTTSTGGALGTRSALAELFAACADDARCDRRYPELEQAWDRALVRHRRDGR